MAGPMTREIVSTSKAPRLPSTYSQALKAPARQGAKLPVRMPGLKISIAVIAEA